jgi:hypothetical protein
VTIDVLPGISRPDSCFKVMGDNALFLVERVCAEIGVVAENSLRCILRAFRFGRRRAFLVKYRNGSISARKLCGDMPSLVVDQHAKWKFGESRVGFDLTVLQPDSGINLDSNIVCAACPPL